jgi:hypothetical protein
VTCSEYKEESLSRDKSIFASDSAPSSSAHDPSSTFTALVYRPAIPVDIINTIVDEVEASPTADQSRLEGKRLSLVLRDWRDAGQRLVFRTLRLKSVNPYSSLVRALVKQDCRLASFVRILKIKQHSDQVATSSTTVKGLVDSLTQLKKLRLEAVPKTMSRLLDLFKTNLAGRRLEELTLAYVPSRDLFDFSSKDLLKLRWFRNLASLCLILPPLFPYLLPASFAPSDRVSLRSMRLHLPRTESGTHTEAIRAVTSFLVVEMLEIFVSAPSTTACRRNASVTLHTSPHSHLPSLTAQTMSSPC